LGILPSQYQVLALCSNTVLSKRKLHKLIHDNHVTGWDDPRIFTLDGMRRRGIPAEAINEFCDQLGVTRRGNETIIPLHFLESVLRRHLDVIAPRRLTVLDPVKLTIINFAAEKMVPAQHFPKNPEQGTYDLSVTKTLFVERDDVREKDSKDHFGFAPNKIVGLKYLGVVKVT
jgi:glutaminyl-tRNA synthetase